MRGYYISPVSNSIGVNRKIEMQIEQLSIISDVSRIILREIRRSLFFRLISCFPTASIGYDFASAQQEILQPDYLYIRRMQPDSALIWFLKNIKMTYPKCKIILEIPVYPYFKDNYFHSLMHFFRSIPNIIKEIIYTPRTKRYIDRIVTYSEDNVINGIPTISTMNGVNVKSFKVISPFSHKTTEPINLIAVAMVAPHHGYERIIDGLHTYYQNKGSRNIIFHIVGNGSILDVLRKMVKRYRLEKHVIFHGKRDGTALDEIYEGKDIGVGCFGLYKDGRSFISSIKVCEYMAKGLPVISGVKENLYFQAPTDYQEEFENKPIPVDMRKVVSFYDRIYLGEKTHEQILGEIRQYALEHVDNSVVFRPICQYLLGK